MKPLIALACIVAMALLMASCRSTKEAAGGTYLSSKVKVSLPLNGGTLSVSGNLKLVGGERMQLSLLMPILRTEVVRIEITPDGLLLVDRMGKQYIQASRAELRPLLPRRADFTHLEKLLLKAARKGRVSLDAADIGIPKLQNCKLTLSDFSNKPVTIHPFTPSAKYKRVELEELVAMLTGITIQ